ncbi:MAG: hypothetical protein EXS10_00465 [Phycisphaerales bacterium]|nr:hypothetical protein [Phycisphaerales bacterium]
MQPTRALFATLCTATFAVSCSTYQAPERNAASAISVTKGFLFDGNTFSFDEPLELQTHGPLAIDFESFAGKVEIRADKSFTCTVIEARRVAAHGWGRLAEGNETLTDVRWRASLERREGSGETLVVRASTSHPEDHFQRCEFLITVPELDSVKVRTTEGEVRVTGNQGAVDIRTTEADVRVMTPWAMTKPITIITSEGTIDYRIRGESTGLFDAETRGGLVKQRCEFGHWLALSDQNDHDRFLAVLNNGKNPIVLRTSDGDIRIAVVPDPTSVGIWIMDP